MDQVEVAAIILQSLSRRVPWLTAEEDDAYMAALDILATYMGEPRLSDADVKEELDAFRSNGRVK